MGYARYTLPDGREGGYAVPAICGNSDCDEVIDRGLGFLCGETPGGDEYGCGGYFCGRHLICWPVPVQMCLPCADEWEREHSDSPDGA